MDIAYKGTRSGPQRRGSRAAKGNIRHVLEQWWPAVAVGGSPGAAAAIAARGAAAGAAGPVGRRAVRRAAIRRSVIAAAKTASASLPGGSAARSARRHRAGRSAIVLVIWLASGFYRVQPDEQGVVLRFGAFNRITAARPQLSLPVADRTRADARR